MTGYVHASGLALGDMPGATHALLRKRRRGVPFLRRPPRPDSDTPAHPPAEHAPHARPAPEPSLPATGRRGACEWEPGAMRGASAPGFPSSRSTTHTHSHSLSLLTPLTLGERGEGQTSKPHLPGDAWITTPFAPSRPPRAPGPSLRAAFLPCSVPVWPSGRSGAAEPGRRALGAESAAAAAAPGARSSPGAAGSRSDAASASSGPCPASGSPPSQTPPRSAPSIPSPFGPRSPSPPVVTPSPSPEVEAACAPGAPRPETKSRLPLRGVPRGRRRSPPPALPPRNGAPETVVTPGPAPQPREPAPPPLLIVATLCVPGGRSVSVPRGGSPAAASLLRARGASEPSPSASPLSLSLLPPRQIPAPRAEKTC